MTTNPKHQKSKIIKTICLACGKKYDKKHKNSFGVWKATCDICGKENVPCADAAHDFGIYSNKNIEEWDKVQDRI